MDNSEDDWYDILDGPDRPSDVSERQALEIARLRGQIEKQKTPKVEKFYLVRGHEVFVCHQSQLEIKRYKDETSGQILRDFKANGVRMVVYGEDGIKKVDR